MLLVGFTLAMACVKFALLARRGGEAFRGWGLMSYGLLVITPALSGLGRFGEALFVLPLLTYAAGLCCGVVSLRVVYTVTPEWRRMRGKDDERSGQSG